MANAMAVNSCCLCQTPMDAGNQPEVVMCAQGHPFHKNCVLITPNMYLNCPVDSCGEQFTSYSKSLGNRLVRSLMSQIGILDHYERALTVYINEKGITREYASAVLTESDYAKMCIKELPAAILDSLSIRSFLMLVGPIIAYYALPLVRDYFQQQLYSNDKENGVLFPVQ